jgi:hypothetical protein
MPGLQDSLNVELSSEDKVTRQFLQSLRAKPHDDQRHENLKLHSGRLNLLVPDPSIGPEVVRPH